MPSGNRDLPSFPFAHGPYGTATLTYDLFRKSCPIREILLPSGWKAWLVTSYAGVRAVHTHIKFSRSEAVRVGATLGKETGIELEPTVLQNSDGKQHARLRKIFGARFGVHRNTEWKETIENEVDSLLDRLKRANVDFDLRKDLFDPLATNCAERLFGFPRELEAFPLELFFDEGMRTIAVRRMAELVENSTKLPDDAFMKGLVFDHKANRLSESELIMNLVILATATFGAVRAAFLGGMFALLRHVEQWRACVRDRSLVPAAVAEMLRCFPNGDGQFLRLAEEDIELCGVKISRGEAVLAPFSAANVDPSVFVDPRSFDIFRPDSDKHIAFGVGRHRCLGANLAELWMRTTLHAIVERFPNLRLAVDSKEVNFGAHPLIYKLEELRVRDDKT
jgi:cytochrome P450